MSLKQLLGLQSCPLNDLEIMNKLQNAYHHDLRIVEFPLQGSRKTVQVLIKGINTQGIMKEYETEGYKSS